MNSFIADSRTRKAQTLSEKILSRAAGRTVGAGDPTIVNLDLVMLHDSIAPSVIRILQRELGVDRVFDPERIAVVIDHVSPAANLATAEAQRDLRRWVKEQEIVHFFDSGRGIAHQALIENRLARPGRLIIGSDSHSTAYGAVAAFGTGMGATDIALGLATGQTWVRAPKTIRIEAMGRFQPGTSPKDFALWLARTLRADGANYHALEYHGFDFLSVGERTTLATMSLEVGADAGLVATGGLPDDYPVPGWLDMDHDAPCARVISVALDEIEPQIALPGRVDNVTDLSDVTNVKVDVVYLGTCTNGRHEDMRAAANILRGKRVAPGVRLMVVPASSEQLKAAVADGSLATLLEAGATVGPPGCGACMGRHMGVLAADEVCLFTGNRNFVGRMGSPDAKIYLASPEVAAATAIAGRIADPREFMRDAAGTESLTATV
jgi:methanogen homoaconitase large subunit